MQWLGRKKSSEVKERTNSALNPRVAPVRQRLDFERSEARRSRLHTKDVLGHECSREAAPVVRLGGLEVVSGVSSVSALENGSASVKSSC